MEQYYIALNPEKKLADLVNNQKKLVQKTIGNQKYLQDPPHLTLIIFTTDKLNDIIQELENIIKNLPKFNIKLKDFHVFYNDPWTKCNTITYSLSEENLSFLRKIQLKVTDSIDKFNTKGFDYAYIGDKWIPHITIASIELDKFDLVF